MSSSAGSDVPSHQLRQTPRLRLWGYFETRGDEYIDPISERRKHNYSISINGHDGVDGIDLSRTSWYKDQNAFGTNNEYSSIHRADALKHTNLRLDKLSVANDWEPFTAVVNYEAESEVWVPVMVILFNKARPAERFPYHSIKHAPILSAIVRYFDTLQSKGDEARLESGPNIASEESTLAPSTRGRMRKRLRRHNKEFTLQSGRASSAEASTALQPVVLPILRGRARRTHRRNKLHCRLRAGSSIGGSTAAQNTGTVAVKPSWADALRIERLPRHMRDVPLIVIQESRPLHPHGSANDVAGKDSVIIPVHVGDIPSKLTGCLLISKQSLGYGLPRFELESRIISIQLVTIRNVMGTNPNAPNSYWEKFPLQATTKFNQDLAQNGRGYSYEDSFATTWSDGYRSWLSPDETLGPLTECDSEGSTLGGSNAEVFHRWVVEAEDQWHEERDGTAHRFPISDEPEHLDSSFKVPQPPSIDRPEQVRLAALEKGNVYFSRAMRRLATADSQWGKPRSQHSSQIWSRVSGSISNSIQQGSVVSRSPPLSPTDAFSGPRDHGPPGAQRCPSRTSVESSHSSGSRKETQDSDQLHNSGERPAGFDPQDQSSAYDLAHPNDGIKDSDSTRLSGSSCPPDHDSDRYSIDDIEQHSNESLLSLFNDKTFDIFYSPEYQSHIPFRTQKLHGARVLEIALDATHHRDVRAHATAQYGICLLSGYGIDQDVEAGLRWVLAAAEAGDRMSRAIVRRLYRAYRVPMPPQDHSVVNEWLVHEAHAGSYWALEELYEDESQPRGLDEQSSANDEHPTFDGILRDSVFYDINFREESTFFDNRVRDFFDLTDDQVLRKQLVSRGDDCQISPSKLNYPLTDLGSNEAKREFFNSAIRWSCIYASPEIVTTIFELMEREAVSYNSYCDKARRLCLALRARRMDVVRVLLESVEALQSTEMWKYDTANPLFHLTYLGADDVDYVVQKLVQLGIDVNEKEDIRDVWRLERDSIFDVKDHKDLHWLPDVTGKSMTPLRWAIFHNRAHVVEVLLRHGAQFPRVPDEKAPAVNREDGLREELATVAVLDEPCFNIEILKMFFLRHGRQGGQASFPETPLGLLVQEPDSPQRRLRLADRGNPNNLFPILTFLRTYQPDCDAELLWAALKNGHLDVVVYLLDEGVDIETRHKGLTPLHTAILYGRRRIFSFLLSRGADPRAVTTTKGISTIHLNFWKPRPERTEVFMLDELYKRVGDVSGKFGAFGHKITPLHLAVLNGRIAGVTRLMQLGADPCCVLAENLMPTPQGGLYTHWGIERWRRRRKGVGRGDRTEMPKLDISLDGLTPSGLVLTRWDMFTPLQIQKLLKLLLSGTPTSPLRLETFYTRPNIKQTVLHLMVSNRALMGSGTFEEILDMGKPVGLYINTRDIDGDTPLHYAALVTPTEDQSTLTTLQMLGADNSIRNDYGLTSSEVRFWGSVHYVNVADPTDEETTLSIWPQSDTSHWLARDQSVPDEVAPDTEDGPESRFWSALINNKASFGTALDMETMEMREFPGGMGIRLSIG